MKNFTKSFFFIVVLLVNSFICFSQTDNHHEHNHRTLNEKAAMEQFDVTAFMAEFSEIALVRGYDLRTDECLRNALIFKQSNLSSDIFSAYVESKPKSEYATIYKKHIKEFTDYLEIFKRNETFLRSEFKRRTESAQSSLIPSNPSHYRSGNPNTPQGPCTNMDFETGNLSGWTTTTTGAGTSYVTTSAASPVPSINQVYAGTYSGCIDILGGGNVGDQVTISQQFLVTQANKDFVFYVAVILDAGPHSCSQNPRFEVSVVNNSAGNTVVPCSNIQLISGSGCSAFSGFASNGTYDYLNWTPVIVPLGSVVGSNVTISFTVKRCTGSGNGGHGALAYIEASCNPIALTSSGSVVCSGAGAVTLTALNSPGYTYNWSGPGGFTGSTASVNATQAGAYTVTMSVASNPTCKMVMDTVIAAVPSPTASFNYTVGPCSPTYSVPVVSTSIPGAGDPISSYTWVWGDATANGSGASTNHTYASAGPKTAQLIVTSAGGCTATATNSFTFTTGPSAGFNVNNSCLGTASNFTSTSAPAASILSYVWDFGDGVTDNTNNPNPSHTYATTGIKTINYTITATGGCTNTATKTVTISTPPAMGITANTVCLGVPTTFGNTSSALDGISGQSWTFGDGGTSTLQTPTYTYPTSGNFTAVLTATSNGGCVNTMSIPVKVNALPTATFTPGSACLNNNVLLNNTSSAVAPDIINSYSWNFGAGATPATGSTANPSPLVYTTSGVKNITLNLIASNSCTATITRTVEVFPQPVANFNTTSVCQGTATAFTDLSTPTGSITNWAWDYTNDGTTDNITNAPTNVYTSSGTFTASLIVIDNHGCRDTVKLPVSVWGHSIPSFTVNKGCLGTVSSFTNTTDVTTNQNIGGTPTWLWNFGDGVGTSVTQNPTYTYAASSVYSATLTSTTSNGCVDVAVRTITVNTIPTPSFTAVNACLNANVVLNNSSSVPAPDAVSSYTWNFGPNSLPVSTSNAQTPVGLNYNSSGIKVITLSITANTTCSATVTQTVEIYPQPVANFSTTSVCQGTATAFTDLSTPVGSITAWDWDFTNNGTNDNFTNAPTHVYTTSGTFTAGLVVTDINSCKDTVKLQVNVWGHTIPDFTPNNVCFGTASVFTNQTNETTNPNVGTGSTYVWDFADGQPTSTLNNPTHTYTLGGNGNATYNVTLTATSQHNCVDNVVKVVNVYAIPTASFTSDSVCLGTATHLLDASNGNGNTVNTYTWDFLSDGVDVTGVTNPNYIFPAFGINSVSYTVSTSPVVGLVCSNSTNTITVWVNPNPIPDFTFVNNCINAQPNTFDASSSTIAVGTNTAYVWSYGNGNTSAASASPTSTHIYGAPGTYNVILTVTSNKGCQKNITKQVEVYAKPNVLIANSPACDQAVMTFTSVAQANSGTVTNWAWDFDNSITTVEGTGQTTSFLFSGPGSYTVGLITESTPGGCKDTIRKVVYVNYVPVPNFSVDIPSGCPEHCVTFTDLTPVIPGPSQISQWQWVLGDGTTVTNSSNAAVDHCYTNTSNTDLANFDVRL
ncbi:MAG: PKD domain-containing protein, partial [Bacteroidia bacterium]|nr:PKD domain-containing protein [Bacteroidia bacterium]